MKPSELIQITPAGDSKSGKQYWRSLNELDGSPELTAWVNREFPEGASELLAGGSRRSVLKLMAASFGLAGLTACRRPAQTILPNVKGIEDYVPGQPYFYATAMPLNGTVLPLLVETHDGRPTKVEGNPDHPYSQGAASAFAQASVLGMYDPDRSTRVLENGKPTDWNALSKFVTGHFSQLGDGEGLRFLSEASTSASLAAVKKEALKKWPKAKWAEYEPVNQDNAVEGAKLAFGQPLVAHPDFEKAKVILALDSDFLGADATTVLPVKQFAKARHAGEPNESEMNRLYAVEANYSLTGGMADHRLRMRSADVQAFAAALANQLGAVTSSATTPHQKFLAAVAKDLQAHAGQCLVVAGARQPAAVHALAHAINDKLNAPVTFTKADYEISSSQTLSELVSEIGQVKTLVLLGGNPVYASPGALQFGAALKKVPVSIHLGIEPDETALAARWHVPQAHYLEAWGDGRTPDGTATIQQPMIEPLYGGKTAAELVAMMMGAKDQTGFAIVRNYWLEQAPAASREKTWRESLHNGNVAGSAVAEAKAKVALKAPDAAAVAAGLEVGFYPSYSVWDGRFANNGWLQECPDPMTKLVWGNAALVSPATAKAHSLSNGDVVKISVGGASAEFPVMIQPGHADDSVSVTLGYGRKVCGRVARDAGYDAYPLMPANGARFATGATITKTGASGVLATTQEHHSIDDPLAHDEIARRVPQLIREATLDEYRRNPKFAEEGHEELVSIYADWEYTKGYQWGMAIDLNACIGCNACTVACQAENNIPIVGKKQVMRGRQMHWIRIDRYFAGSENDPEVVHQGVACMQCENAPCENVCPVAATTHSPEGLNDMAYNRCVGTRYCANNCPYKVRRFNFLNYHIDMEEVEKMGQNPDVSVRMRGVMEKCTYCVQRIQEAKINAKTDGRRAINDGDVVTACQQTCPAGAIVFGNIADPNSRVSKIKKQERNYAMLADLNVRPRTTYLAKLRNPNPELA